MATTKKQVEFVAERDFEWQGKQYKVGDVFTPPSDYRRDEKFEEFRSVAQRPGNYGIPFYYQVKIGNIRNRDGKQEDVLDNRRVILPLIEKGAKTPEGE